MVVVIGMDADVELVGLSTRSLGAPCLELTLTMRTKSWLPSKPQGDHICRRLCFGCDHEASSYLPIGGILKRDETATDFRFLLKNFKNMSDLFAKMLQQNSQRQSGPLIQEIGANEAELPITTPSNSEEPTMLELMMAAQAEARKDKKVEEEILQKKSTKSFGNGFKKGFLGATSDKPKKETTANKVANPTDPKYTTDTVNDIPTISKSNPKKEKSTLVIPEVQDALKEETPMLQQLKAGDWCTPDLVEIFQSNPILAAGFRNPKCTAALQLMQSDPKDRRFANDEEVNVFLREFGRVMAQHFEGLQQKKGSNLSSGGTMPLSPVSEIGPLHADVLKRNKKSKEENTSGVVTTDGTGDVSDDHVQKILADAELREMLMDAEMQKILQECGDPVKFQQHMRNPTIAAKIRKLYENGLVGTTS